MRVFLSYAHEDAEIGESVRASLAAAGYQVWDPALDLEPGANFALAIGDVLEKADALVLLVSPQAMESDWIRWELDYAIANPRFKGRLVPIELRPTESFPWILRRFPVLRFSGESTNSELIAALNRIRDAA